MDMTSTALWVRSIQFKDGTHIHDVYAWITDNFIVVVDDEDDITQIWYNVSTIDKMEVDSVSSNKLAHKEIKNNCFNESNNSKRGRIG